MYEEEDERAKMRAATQRFIDTFAALTPDAASVKLAAWLEEVPGEAESKQDFAKAVEATLAVVRGGAGSIIIEYSRADLLLPGVMPAMFEIAKSVIDARNDPML
jgi:hypothetical protein